MGHPVLHPSRSPSPTDLTPRPILRSRNNSTSAGGSNNEDNSLESILKRRSSLEDLELIERSSPEPQVGFPPLIPIDGANQRENVQLIYVV